MWVYVDVCEDVEVLMFLWCFGDDYLCCVDVEQCCLFYVDVLFGIGWFCDGVFVVVDGDNFVCQCVWYGVDVELYKWYFVVYWQCDCGIFVCYDYCCDGFWIVYWFDSDVV